MAVEAARTIEVDDSLEELIFASTSAYFTERQQAVMAVDALHLSRQVRTQDVANSRRAAVSEITRALHGNGTTLVTAADRRPTKAGSVQNLSYGDGAAACLISGSGGARFLGGASTSFDLVDSYSSVEMTSGYQYEARFIREVAVEKILAPTVLSACQDAGISVAEIDFAVIPEPTSGTFRALAKKIGLGADDVASEVQLVAGDLGVAHPLFSFGVALSRAQPGDIVLLSGFGSGCDALIFELESDVQGADICAQHLQHGEVTDDYVRFLNLHGALEIDWGMRAEFVQKAQGSVLARKSREMMGFVAGQDREGNVQFPKTPVPVHPAIEGRDDYVDVRLADEIGTVVSCTADRLSYCPDPPFTYGLVQFKNGARVMMEFIDTNGRTPQVGEQLKMKFRIKSKDQSRGFRTYFWKAAPYTRSLIEEG